MAIDAKKILAKVRLEKIQEIFADDKGWANEQEMISDLAKFRRSRMKGWTDLEYLLEHSLSMMLFFLKKEWIKKDDVEANEGGVYCFRHITAASKNYIFVKNPVIL